MQPSYHLLAEQLREQIRAGDYQPGQRLPTASELEKQWGVSRKTVLSAYRELGSEGLIHTDGRRGTWVREALVFDTPATGFDDTPGPGDAFVRAVRASGRTPDKSFAMRIEPAEHWVSSRLGLPDDALVCARSLDQRVDGHPWSRATSYYPLDLAEECGLTTPYDIDEGTVARMRSHGIQEVAHYDESATQMPDPDDARELGVPPGTPLLIWTRTAATEQRITRLSRHLMPGDRNRVIHQQGDETALKLIVQTRNNRGEAA